MTSEFWPSIRVAFGWVHRVAHVLANHEASDALGVRRRLAGLIGAMVRHQERAGEHAGAVAHFLKVTRSYWPGLFHCYDWPDLPRTNNDLEQFFGSYRYHERRATGRKVASPSLVLRGSGPALLAATATSKSTVLRPRLGRRQGPTAVGLDPQATGHPPRASHGTPPVQAIARRVPTSIRAAISSSQLCRPRKKSSRPMPSSDICDKSTPKLLGTRKRSASRSIPRPR